MSPQKVNVKSQNLPSISSDDEAKALLYRPSEIENMDKIDRRRENVEGVDFYTAEAQVKVGVSNERQLKISLGGHMTTEPKMNQPFGKEFQCLFTLRHCIYAKSARNKTGNFKATIKIGASWRGEKGCKTCFHNSHLFYH